MARIIKVAGAQMGPTQRADSRRHTLQRLIALMEGAAKEGSDLVVYPELALTTFFPRWLIADAAELDGYFERAMPNPDVQALFDRARDLKIAFSLGYAELTADGHRYNTSIIVGKDGEKIGYYRKVHLPGSVEPRAGSRFQQLEKRYFEYGDLGFPTFRAPGSLGGAVMGMLICNDRRWPEAWRVLSLRGAELVCIGYNSAAYDPNGGDTEDAALRTFHSKLASQSNAYMNSTFAVTVAKAGVEDGAGLIGGSCIIDPNGRILAEARSLADEVIVAECDFEVCRQGREKIFNFAAHRRPQWYTPIVEQVGVTPPA